MEVNLKAEFVLFRLADGLGLLVTRLAFLFFLWKRECWEEMENDECVGRDQKLDEEGLQECSKEKKV